MNILSVFLKPPLEPSEGWDLTGILIIIIAFSLNGITIFNFLGNKSGKTEDGRGEKRIVTALKKFDTVK